MRMLDLTDFGHNPNAKTFGQFGVCYVRYGKASHGSAPKRRSVLTVPEYEWVVDCLRQWIEDIRPMIAEPGKPCTLSHRAIRSHIQGHDLLEFQPSLRPG